MSTPIHFRATLWASLNEGIFLTLSERGKDLTGAVLLSSLSGLFRGIKSLLFFSVHSISLAQLAD
jgi:hypothetical protein